MIAFIAIVGAGGTAMRAAGGCVAVILFNKVSFYDG